MSRVYFHSQHNQAELRGAERAYAANMCLDLMVSILDLDSPLSETHDRLIRFLPDGHRYKLHRPSADLFTISLRVADDMALTLPDGRSADPFTLSLNTAYYLGGDAVKLLARIHGQCEIHAYVEGRNRIWLAEIIERGRKTNVLRDGMGWEDVATLLRLRDDEPVVMSYSVCDSFPNKHSAINWQSPVDESDEPLEDAWYDVPENEQWVLSMEGLRAEPNRGLELTPDNWNSFYFHNGLSGFDVMAEVYKPRKE